MAQFPELNHGRPGWVRWWRVSHGADAAIAAASVADRGVSGKGCRRFTSSDADGHTTARLAELAEKQLPHISVDFISDDAVVCQRAACGRR